MPLRELADAAEKPWGMHEHAAGDLHERLHDERCDRAAMLREDAVEVGERLGKGGCWPAGMRARAAGRRQPDGLERERREHRGEAVDAAHADGAERVAVIGLADRDKPRPLWLRRIGLQPVLKRHLECRLDGAGTVAREEDLLEAGGGHLDEPSCKLDRCGVGEAEVCGVGHLAQLRHDRGVEPRVAVAVDVAPHAGRAIEVAAPGGVDEPRPLAPLDEQRLVFLHLRERVPDVLAIPVSHQVGPDRVGHIVGRAAWRQGDG